MKKFRYIFLAVALSSSLVSFGQVQEILDSLYQKLSETTNDTLKANIYNTLASQYRNSSLDSARSNANKALEIAEKLNLPRPKVRAYFNIGNFYYIKGNFSETIKYYKKALDVLEEENNQEGIASALMGIGNVMAMENNLEKALEFQQRALDIRMEIKDSSGMSSSYNNIGSIYLEMEDYEKALNSFKKSIELREILKDEYGLSSGYGNTGIIYERLGQLDKALEYQKKALEIRMKQNNLKGMALSYADIGLVQFKQKKYDLALQNQLKALELSRKVNFGEGILGCYKSISETYQAMNAYENALEYFKEYTSFKDSLFNLEKTKEIAKIETEYETKEKDKEIKNLNIQKELLELAAKREKIIHNILIGFGILAVIAVIFLLRLNRLRKKAADIANYRKGLVEQKSRLITSKNREIISSIEYARNIQETLLQSKEEFMKVFENCFVFYRPKDIVSGDLFWSYKVSESVSIVAVVDCTGHGVPGAFMSIIAQNNLMSCMNESRQYQPSKILDKMNELVKEATGNKLEGIKSGMDISICKINHSNYTIEYAGAFNPMYLISKEKVHNAREPVETSDQWNLFEFKANKYPIGNTQKTFDNHLRKYNKGDVMILFTDGYPDQFGGSKGKKLNYHRFRKLLLKVQDQPVKAQEVELEKHFEEWKGKEEQLDDICVVGIKL